MVQLLRHFFGLSRTFYLHAYAMLIYVDWVEYAVAKNYYQIPYFIFLKKFLGINLDFPKGFTRKRAYINHYSWMKPHI